MMPHKTHGEEEVDDGEDSVQPEEVIAEEEIPGYQGWASQQKGWGTRLGLNHPQWALCYEPVSGFAPNRGHSTSERSLFLHGL